MLIIYHIKTNVVGCIHEISWWLRGYKNNCHLNDLSEFRKVDGWLRVIHHRLFLVHGNGTNDNLNVAEILFGSVMADTGVIGSIVLSWLFTLSCAAVWSAFAAAGSHH